MSVFALTIFAFAILALTIFAFAILALTIFALTVLTFAIFAFAIFTMSVFALTIFAFAILALTIFALNVFFSAHRESELFDSRCNLTLVGLSDIELHPDCLGIHIYLNILDTAFKRKRLFDLFHT